MPAHISHELFAEEALGLALGEEGAETLKPFRSYWVFGAQGPDFFLHNHRTKPSGLIFGKLLHSEGYGSFVSNLLRVATSGSFDVDSELGAFILGFVTHAVLDRATHPFINYFSGWVELDSPESIRYTHCHAFFERIIDVYLLKLRAGTNVTDYDFYGRVDCGAQMPDVLLDAVARAIEETYPEYQGHRHTRRRIANAYDDTMGFYRFTNPTETDHLKLAWDRDGGGGDPTRRFLALFHPHGLPDLDYLNASQRAWNHPGDPEERRSESFIDLYESALEAAIAPLQAVVEVLRKERPATSVIETIGDENLSDGRNRKAKRRLEYVSPLPLDEVLAAVYAAVGAA